MKEIKSITKSNDKKCLVVADNGKTYSRKLFPHKRVNQYLVNFDSKVYLVKFNEFNLGDFHFYNDYSKKEDLSNYYRMTNITNQITQSEKAVKFENSKDCRKWFPKKVVKEINDEIYIKKSFIDKHDYEIVKTLLFTYEDPSDDEEVEELEFEEVEETEEIETVEGEVFHKEYETIKSCIEENIPVYLYGPAGSGKNFTLQQIAEQLDLDFYFTNSVQQEYKITGFIDAGGTYHETEFYKAFKDGGLFFLDEMDASIPEVLVLLNAAIANKYFEFPTGKIDAHDDFRVVAAGNTLGNGADEQYTGRLQIDQATLDRFVAIEFDYDKRIELSLTNNNTELVEFIRELRKQSEENGIRTTFSYRCLISVTKLENKMSLKKVLLIAVFKGLDQDTLNTFKRTQSNKYFGAMRQLQMGA